MKRRLERAGVTVMLETPYSPLPIVSRELYASLSDSHSLSFRAVQYRSDFSRCRSDQHGTIIVYHRRMDEYERRMDELRSSCPLHFGALCQWGYIEPGCFVQPVPLFSIVSEAIEASRHGQGDWIADDILYLASRDKHYSRWLDLRSLILRSRPIIW